MRWEKYPIERAKAGKNWRSAEYVKIGAISGKRIRQGEARKWS
jgi:hypothetical protein